MSSFDSEFFYFILFVPLFYDYFYITRNEKEKKGKD